MVARCWESANVTCFAPYCSLAGYQRGSVRATAYGGKYLSGSGLFLEVAVLKSTTSAKIIEAIHPKFARFGVPYSLLTYLLILIGPMRTLKAGQKIAPPIPVCHRCDCSPPRMPSQLVSFFLHSSSPRFSRPASPPFTFRCPR